MIPFDVPVPPFPWRKVWATILLIAAAIILLWSVKSGMDASDKAQCETWAAEARNYMLYDAKYNPGGFYITQDEKAQCDYWGIKVAAPVR